MEEVRDGHICVKLKASCRMRIKNSGLRGPISFAWVRSSLVLPRNYNDICENIKNYLKQFNLHVYL